MPALAAARVVTPRGVLAPGVIEVENDRIVSVAATHGRAPERTLVPGFVDLQVNGHDDVDVATARGAQWDRLDDLLLAQGVTTWCPTLVTAPLASYPDALGRIAAAAARPAEHRPAMAGVHLEGPFLGGALGVHRVEWVRPVDVQWLEELPPHVRVVTLAPEREGALEAIAALRRREVVVALGHSDADHDQAAAAFAAGARLVTHLFNGMGPFHHRAPGLAGAALADPRATVSLIADLVHVHPAALRIAFAAKGVARVALVTDAVAWRADAVAATGVRRAEDGVPRRPDGTLAGTALQMDVAVRNLVAAAGVDLSGAVAAAASTPAKLLGLEDRGRIEAGLRADVVALGPDLAVESVWVGGRHAWG